METDRILDAARGIGDYGAVAMMAAAFLVLSVGLMGACFAWFRSLVNGIVRDNRSSMKELLDQTRMQNELLSDISEGLRPETLMRIKNIGSVFFDLSKERVCRLIKKIREENHIADRAATGVKIRTLLRNIHDDRNARFDSFTYRGRRLSTYTDPAWVEKIAAVVETELYHTDGPNNGRAFTNVSMAYDNVKLDFYHRLNYE